LIEAIKKKNVEDVKKYVDEGHDLKCCDFVSLLPII